MTPPFTVDRSITFHNAAINFSATHIDSRLMGMIFSLINEAEQLVAEAPPAAAATDHRPVTITPPRRTTRDRPVCPPAPRRLHKYADYAHLFDGAFVEDNYVPSSPPAAAHYNNDNVNAHHAHHVEEMRQDDAHRNAKMPRRSS